MHRIRNDCGFRCRGRRGGRVLRRRASNPPRSSGQPPASRTRSARTCESRRGGVWPPSAARRSRPTFPSTGSMSGKTTMVRTLLPIAESSPRVPSPSPSVSATPPQTRYVRRPVPRSAALFDRLARVPGHDTGFVLVEEDLPEVGAGIGSLELDVVLVRAATGATSSAVAAHSSRTGDLHRPERLEVRRLKRLFHGLPRDSRRPSVARTGRPADLGFTFEARRAEDHVVADLLISACRIESGHENSSGRPSGRAAAEGRRRAGTRDTSRSASAR